MNFSEAVKSAFTRMADYRGRSSRSEYWWFGLFNCLSLIGIEILVSIAGGNGVTSLFTRLAQLLFLLGPGLPLLVRRLHDTNKSGWFALIGFLPLTEGTARPLIGSVVLLILTLIGSVALLILTLLPSNMGNNKYGSNPLI